MSSLATRLRKNRRFRPIMEELEGRLAPVTDLFTVGGTPGTQTSVDFTYLARHVVFQNEVGVYAVDDNSGSVLGLAPGEEGYTQRALTFAQTVVPSNARLGGNTQLTFAAGTQLAFYLVQNNSRAAVLSSNPQNIIGRGPIAFLSIDGAGADSFDHVRAITQGDGGLRLSFEDLTGGGDQDFNDAIITVGSTGLFRSPGQLGQAVSTRFTWLQRTAEFAHEVGLFQVFDVAGRVNGILPGAAGYREAALAGGQVIFSRGMDAGAERTIDLASELNYGLYMVQNSTTASVLAGNPANVFFSILRANPDGTPQFDFMTANGFGFEDGRGGGDFDYNDFVGSFVFGAVTGTPLNDGAAPAITARLQNDTSDPARVGPPDNGGSDLRTSDFAITGTVTDISQVTSFVASIDNASPSINVLDTLQADTTFVFDRARMEAIFDPTNNPALQLPDGVHILRLQARDQFGNTSGIFSFQFTVDRVGPTMTLQLAAVSDTGFVGEFRTDNTTVDLTGTTEANASVRLVRNNVGGPVTIANTTANASGQYTFTNVALNAGPNALKAFSLDVVGNQGESGVTITRNVAPIAREIPSAGNVPLGGSTQVNLTPQFFDPDNGQPIVRVDTFLGSFLVQLFQNRTPLHTQNFLNYANDNDYDTTIFHRSIPGFVIQGGGFRFTGGNPNLVDQPADPPVTNEPGLFNSRGTIALAKLGGDPNSGTNEWFVNLGDNSLNLDNQNGGFTVFGQVVGNGNTVYDAIAAVPTFDLGQFQDIPLRNFTGNSIQDATAANFALINDVFQLADPLSYTVASVSTTPGLTVSTSITGSLLTVTHTGGPAGTATITIRGTDSDGTNTPTNHTILVTVA